MCYAPMPRNDVIVKKNKMAAVRHFEFFKMQ